jgi:phage-related protein
MKKVREVIAYKHYFEDFLKGLSVKAQNKIFKIIEAIETFERVPANYLKYIKGTKGLFEARAKLGNNTWRVFCFFDDGKLVILLNGITKKTHKTPKNEIAKAELLMKEYYNEKRRQL